MILEYAKAVKNGEIISLLIEVRPFKICLFLFKQDEVPVSVMALNFVHVILFLLDIGVPFLHRNGEIPLY